MYVFMSFYYWILTYLFTQVQGQLAPSPIPVPISMWELRREYSLRRDSVWAVFRTHEEVCNLLVAIFGWSRWSRAVKCRVIVHNSNFHRPGFRNSWPPCTELHAVLGIHPVFYSLPFDCSYISPTDLFMFINRLPSFSCSLGLQFPSPPP